MHAGIYPDQAGFAAQWQAERRFEPDMKADERDAAYARWKRAVSAAMQV
jgi:glycerol kinase